MEEDKTKCINCGKFLNETKEQGGFTGEMGSIKEGHAIVSKGRLCADCVKKVHEKLEICIKCGKHIELAKNAGGGIDPNENFLKKAILTPKGMICADCNQ